ncbi:MAG: GNAT family N-acetyltransferase [Carbonactinosporaceae bacterium]
MTVRVTVRQGTQADEDEVLRVHEFAFGIAPRDGAARARRREVLDYRRSLVAVAAGELCGTAASHAFTMAVPGGLRPVAGVAAVGVLPTHRRRGVLTALIRRQLTDLHEGGEALAALYASEPAIYGRFGYGAASYDLTLTLPRDPAALETAPGDDTLRFRITEPHESLELIEPLHARLVRARPGMIVREPAWARRAVSDPPEERAGASPLRCVLAEDAGGVRGYAWYRTTLRWVQESAAGTVAIREAFAGDPPAYAAVWRYLLSLDLMARVETGSRPVDDPLLAMLADARRGVPTVHDGLYVRTVEVGRALSSRTYSASIDAVLQVRDPFCGWNEGRWRLAGGPEGATCERTRAPADLELGARELGAAYLGGTSLRLLREAGRVSELRRGALQAVSRAFAHDPLPYCQVGF